MNFKMLLKISIGSSKVELHKILIFENLDRQRNMSNSGPQINMKCKFDIAVALFVKFTQKSPVK